MKKLLGILFILIGVNTYAQQTNNQGFTIVAQQSADGKQYKTLNGRHVPYASSVEYLATVVSTRRHIGQIAYIANGAAIELWQFVGGIADVNFVKIQLGGSGITLTTNNTSGLATLVGNNLNIPNYAMASIVAGTNVTVSGAGTSGSPYIISSIGGGTGGNDSAYVNFTVDNLNNTIFRRINGGLDTLAINIPPSVGAIRRLPGSTQVQAFISGVWVNQDFIDSVGAGQAPVYQQKAVVYTGTNGIEKADSTALYFDGQSLGVNRDGTAGLATSSFTLNYGRAELRGSFNGLEYNVGAGFAGGGVFDNTKQYRWYNRGNLIFGTSMPAPTQTNFVFHTRIQMDSLPLAPGTQELRIDAAGNLSRAAISAGGGAGGYHGDTLFFTTTDGNLNTAANVPIDINELIQIEANYLGIKGDTAATSGKILNSFYRNGAGTISAGVQRYPFEDQFGTAAAGSNMVVNGTGTGISINLIGQGGTTYNWKLYYTVKRQKIAL